MPRKPRIELIGYHHVLNRGVEKRQVFLNDEDFKTFLELLCGACQIYGVTLHSYALMDNHYHLLIETSQENLSMFMRRVNADYAMHFNKRYNRSGHLWQGRFKSWYVADESYLYTLIRYIEYNPLKAGVIKKMGDYAYSSCRYFLGKDNKPPSCLKKSIMLEAFESDESRWEFFQSGIDERVLDEIQKGSALVVMSEKPKHDDAQALREIFEEDMEKETRNKKVLLAYDAGISQHKIAAFLELSQPTINAIIKRERKKSDDAIA